MAIPLVVLVVHELWTMRVPGFVIGDFAVSNVATRSALHLNRLLGPYSRFGWSHPGPTIYYLSTPLFAASGQRYGGLTATAALLNLVFAVGIVAVVGRVGAKRDGVAAGAVMLVFLSFGGLERWRSAWNPDMVVLLVAAVVILAAVLVGGRRWALPVLALVASLTVQTHIGTLVAVAAVVVVALGVWVWLERHQVRTWRRPLAWTGLGLAVLWAVPIYEQFTRNPGNLTLLWRFFFEGGAPRPKVSLAQALRLVVGQATLSSVPDNNSVVARIAPLSWWRWGALVVLTGLAIAGCVVAWRRGDRFVAALRGLPIVALAASVVAVLRIAGPIETYLTSYSLSVGLCLWIGAASTIAELLDRGAQLFARHSGAPPRTVGRLRRAMYPIAAGALVVGGLAVGWSWRTMSPVSARANAQGRDTFFNMPAVGQVSDAVQARAPKGQPILIEIHGLPAWPIAAGVIDALEHDGRTVRVGRDWEFMFGDSHRPGHEPAAGFAVTPPGAIWAVPGTIPIPLPANTGVLLYAVPPSTHIPPSTPFTGP